ncbi:hypothetical protein E1B28_002838 [Marasmius oreades]|uniref:Uncharacterized protein n=1 Tax=Marasmius oreades TaxID=181124 RepID=A0A9P7RNV2_9AGAR|nr:uncharacterized protein E1B28_002838 [Marasmius oreades]KAG7086922.1 hypothetical protein E1B28_002838 [Marasmius oreades]
MVGKASWTSMNENIRFVLHVDHPPPSTLRSHVPPASINQLPSHSRRAEWGNHGLSSPSGSLNLTEASFLRACIPCVPLSFTRDIWLPKNRCLPLNGKSFNQFEAPFHPLYTPNSAVLRWIWISRHDHLGNGPLRLVSDPTGQSTLAEREGAALGFPRYAPDHLVLSDTWL